MVNIFYDILAIIYDPICQGV